MDDLEWRNVRGLDHLVNVESGEILATLRMMSSHTYRLEMGAEPARQFIDRDKARRFALARVEELAQALKAAATKKTEKPPKGEKDAGKNS